jgi:superfamily I DNA and/or RNA helicase
MDIHLQVPHLQKHIPRNRNITVGSVYKCQGLERRVVIASLVRSTVGNIASSRLYGSLTEPHIINAMMSRAQHLIIVVGSKEHFQLLGLGFWHEILQKANHRNV